MDFTFKPRPFSFEIEYRCSNTKRIAGGLRYIENLSGYIWDFPSIGSFLTR